MMIGFGYRIGLDLKVHIHVKHRAAEISPFAARSEVPFLWRQNQFSACLFTYVVAPHWMIHL